MPKPRKETRKGTNTLRVPSLESFRAEGDRVGSLLVVQGADLDLGRHVLVDRATTIGRDDDNELALNDGSISRRHCRVERDAATGIYTLVDLGSTNGTIVNGHRVGDRYPLREGDKVFLGASVVKFSYSDWVDLEYQSRVEEMVATDSLTGLASRRQYELTFTAMAERAQAEQSVLTLMVMDLDGLKEINDRHGHHMGGYVIAEVATVIRQVLEPHGVVCRYGGDEFVGCFPMLDRCIAATLAEDVRRGIAEMPIEKDGVPLPVTMSIGLASYPGDAERPAELFTVADRALYKAKRGGRNQVAAPDRASTSDGTPTLT